MIIEGVLAIGAYSRFNQLENYLKTTEEYLIKAKTEFEADFDDQVNKLSSLEERKEFAEYYFNGYEDYDETYPEILRSSFLVSALFLLEHEMWRFYIQLKRGNLIQSSWDNAKDNFLERFKKCCKEARLPLSFGDTTWQEIQRYYLVRNCVVHNSGFIRGFNKEKDLLPYAIEKNITKEVMSFPETRTQTQIALTEHFCREVISTMWAFLSKVFETYESQKQAQKAGS